MKNLSRTEVQNMINSDHLLRSLQNAANMIALGDTDAAREWMSEAEDTAILTIGDIARAA